MTREEAIKWLEYSKEAYECMSYGAPRIALDMAIAALREQGGSFQNGNNHNMVKDWTSYMDLPRERIVPDTNVGNKWISVNDHLPADTEKVLVYTTTGNTTVARWSQRQEKFVASGHITVTHWMALPEKPEVEV